MSMTPNQGIGPTLQGIGPTLQGIGPSLQGIGRTPPNGTRPYPIQGIWPPPPLSMEPDFKSGQPTFAQFF